MASRGCIEGFTCNARAFRKILYTSRQAQNIESACDKHHACMHGCLKRAQRPQKKRLENNVSRLYSFDYAAVRWNTEHIPLFEMRRATTMTMALLIIIIIMLAVVSAASRYFLLVY